MALTQGNVEWGHPKEKSFARKQGLFQKESPLPTEPPDETLRFGFLVWRPSPSVLKTSHC